ncbi:MAG: hypothetical protein DMG24_17425, partial [Acidobacteria bacterium]
RRSLVAVAWNGAERYAALDPGQQIDLAFTLEENTFDGLVGLELGVRDLKVRVKDRV